MRLKRLIKPQAQSVVLDYNTMKKIKIFYSTYMQIMECFKNAPIESGGIFATDDSGIICDIYFCGCNNEKEFVISPKVFNSKIAEWYDNNIMFAWIIHSHPNGLSMLSDNDKEYAKKVLKLNPFMKGIQMGIITYESGQIKLKFYTIYKNSCKEKKFEVV